jgi:hypothetical protein
MNKMNQTKITREEIRKKYADLLERCEFGNENAADQIIDLLQERDLYKRDSIEYQQQLAKRELSAESKQLIGDLILALYESADFDVDWQIVGDTIFVADNDHGFHLAAWTITELIDCCAEQFGHDTVEELKASLQ